jgi:hypothetical protein
MLLVNAGAQYQAATPKRLAIFGHANGGEGRVNKKRENKLGYSHQK